MESFFSPSTLDDSGLERLMVAELAYELFSQNPFFGVGFGASRELGVDVSTHNMFLFMGLEFGLLGVLLHVFFIMTLFLGMKRAGCHRAYLIPVFIFYWSFFSHNIYDEFHQLIVYAFCGAGLLGAQRRGVYG